MPENIINRLAVLTAETYHAKGSSRCLLSCRERALFQATILRLKSLTFRSLQVGRADIKTCRSFMHQRYQIFRGSQQAEFEAAILKTVILQVPRLHVRATSSISKSIRDWA